MDTTLESAIDRHMRSNQVDRAADFMETRLRAVAKDRFASLAESHFTNPPGDVLAYLNEFIDACRTRCDVRAVYLEMNGFDINYDRWYFDPFAYTDYSADPDDLDWLCDWVSPQWPTMTLTGLEQTQDDFRWYMENRIYENKTHDTEVEIAACLVTVRFVQLIQASLQSGTLICPVPVLATAHDFEIHGRFLPGETK